MNRKLYIVTFLLLFLISCSKENTEMGMPIIFSTSIEMPTKVDDEYFLSGEKLGLFGFNLPKDLNWDGSSISPDFMYNSVLEHKGSRIWETDKVYYWSPDPENRKRFYAYYPFTESGSTDNITISPSDYSGSPYIDFTVTDGKTDFIVCDAKEGNVENPTISFVARHALAKLTFSFATDLEEGMAYVKADKIYGLIKNGLFRYDAQTGNGFDNGTDTLNLRLQQPDSCGTFSCNIYVNSNEPVHVNEYTLYLLPPNNIDGKGGLIKLDAIINGKEKDFDLSSVPLVSGKNTEVKIIVNQKEISFTATVQEWEVGGSVNDKID